MKKYLLAILVIIISLFFINSKANFKYNVNYLTVNRHIENLTDIDSDDKDLTIFNYIVSETENYDVELEIVDDSIIIKKMSDNSSAKTIAFITQYNTMSTKPDVNTSALQTSTLLGAIRSYNNLETDNNIYFIFSDNADYTLNGNSKFLEEHSDLYQQFDYVISLDARGVSGELYLYSSSTKNTQITKFYKNSVTSASGFSDFTVNYNSKELGDTEIISLALFDDPHLFYSQISTQENLDENSVNIYTNTVHELVKSSHTYEFEDNSGTTVYYNSFDNFVTINSVVITVMLIVFLLSVIYFVISYKNEINFKHIRNYTLIILSIIVFATALSILPLQELFSMFSISSVDALPTQQLYIANDTVYLFSIIAILVYTLIAFNITHKKHRLTYIETLISSSFIIMFHIIVSYALFHKLNSILVIIAILHTLIFVVTKINEKLSVICLYLFMFITIPIITNNIYFIYVVSTPVRLIFFALTVAIYITAVFPIITYNYESIKKSGTLN